MDNVGNILKKVLNKRGLANQANAARVCYMAALFIETKLPETCNFLNVNKFNDGVLTIAADNSIAAQECHLIHHLIIEHINKTFLECGLNEIRIIRVSVAS